MTSYPTSSRSALDSLARIIAHKRTLKRDSLPNLPIAGGQGSCDNSDVCSYLTDPMYSSINATFQSLVSGGAIYDNLMLTLNYAADVDGNVGTPGTPGTTLFEDLGTVAARIGTDLVDSNSLFDLLNLIYPETQTAANEASSAAGGVATLQSNVGSPAEEGETVFGDLEGIALGTTLDSAIQELLQLVIGTEAAPEGILLQTVVQAFENSSSGNSNVTLGQLLQALDAGPPLSKLHVGTFAAIPTAGSIVIPTGCYGLLFEFDVPDYWAGRGTVDRDLSPSIANINYSWNGYFFQNPIYIRQENAIAYPLRLEANGFSMNLAPGVSGSWAPLLL